MAVLEAQNIGQKPSTASGAHGVRNANGNITSAIPYNNIKVSRPGMRRVNQQEQIFKSLEIESKFKRNADNINMIDPNDVAQAKMRQRPMTGAV